jgi:dsDNA-specific endonuclease/ATPase MutS2
MDAGHKRSRSRPVASENGSERTRPKRVARSVSAEVDLHGLTVEEALDRVQHALNEALPSVRGFRLDPRNEGVTIVSL